MQAGRGKPMTGSINYPNPIFVNGYSCKNCTDVDLAKKHIDPDHPKAGPYGINAQNDPTLRRLSSVSFGGSLSNLNRANLAPSPSAGANPAASHNRIDLVV
jgi:hypothetical protein